jgi:biopolymer transport protein ExbD
MKVPSPLLRGRKEVDINSAMTPMIDVVFLLLVFFVWTASFVIIEHILPSQLSAQTGQNPVQQVDPPPKQDFDNIVIKIGWDGSNPIWAINEQPLSSLAEVRDRLTVVAEIQPEAPIILHPQPIVPLGFVIEAYDVAKTVGFAKIAFAVNPQSNSNEM